MKKVFALLLAALMAVSLFACGNTEEKEQEQAETKLQLGYGRACITPEMSVPLKGYGTSTDRMSTGVLNDLYVICLAMSDGEQTALLFSQDLYVSSANYTPSLRSELTAAVGVPGTNIFFAATATHSAPDLKSDHESMAEYIDIYKAAVVQAAKDAIADMAPTTMHSATTEVEGMSFVHHYKLSDGTVEDGYYGFFEGKEITGHAAEPDTTMRLVKAERKDKPAVLMINWQCRPTLVGSKENTQLSSDFVGYLRDKVEAEGDMLPVYFTGAYGDLSPTSLIESEDHGLDVKAYGEKLADIAMEAASGELTEMDGSMTVGVYSINGYGFKINHTEEDRLEDAGKVVAERKENGYESADKLAKEMGFRSVYHAGSIVSRPGRKEKENIEVSTLRFGEMGFLMAPMALFSSTGDQTLTDLPTRFGFLLCQSNAAWNTIPSEEAFAYGGYEVDSSYFAPGEAERLSKNLKEMLLMSTDD